MDAPRTRFLTERFPGLAKSPEVAAAANRIASRTGTEVSRDSDVRIQMYLDRFTQILHRDDLRMKEIGLRALKKVISDRYVVRIEDIPDSYWQAQLRVVRNRGGSGDLQNLTEEEVLKLKQEHLSQSKKDQQGSIEEWIDYMASDSSSYLPDYLKYWAFAGMLKLERYVKAKRNPDGTVAKPGRFPERPTGRQRTIKMFPEVNESGLKFIASAYKQLAEGKNIYWGYNQEIPEDARQPFLDALKKKDFRAAYGWVQEHIPPISDEELQITQGDNCGWVTFSKKLGHSGGDIAATLAGKGTGWCIAGREIAQGNYLDQGAMLHIYYTRDKDGNQTNPRVVIVEMGGKVTEVRGIEWEEHIDDYIKPTDVIKKKLADLPGGDEFFETDADTKFLTAIDQKMQRDEKLTREELIFLYEIDKPIRYFGYRKDPRIEELRAQRNLELDTPVILNCNPEEIAYSRHELSTHTKTYIGPLIPEVFKEANSVQHIYLSFPNEKISINELLIDAKGKKELLLAIEKRKIIISQFFRSPNFMPTRIRLSQTQKLLPSETKPAPETVAVVQLRVRDLGFTSPPTTAELFAKAKEFGLELCSAEIGLQYYLQHPALDIAERTFIGIHPPVPLGDPTIIVLEHYFHGTMLHPCQSFWPDDHRWHPTEKFAFRISKNA